MLIGKAVWCVETLVTDGASVEKACQRVAKEWNATTGESRTWEAVKKWYSARDRWPEDDPAAVVLDTMRRESR